MTLVYCKFKLQTRNFHKTRSLISHLDACTSMEHVDLSYCTQNILDIIHTLGQVRAKILCPNPSAISPILLWMIVSPPT
jgi:hypothetical protein